jgi:hypothetical protein
MCVEFGPFGRQYAVWSGVLSLIPLKEVTMASIKRTQRKL